MAKILKIASYLPEDKITNEELSNRFKNWSPEKIFLKTGINKRSKSRENETSADLAILAAKKVFDNFEISKKEIDMLIFVTQTQNQCLPTSACEIHNSLGLKTECGAFDINQGCTGYIYGLFVANNLINNKSIKNILLLTGDTYTKLIDPYNASVSTLFGDGASATIIGQGEKSAIGEFEFGTDGSKSGLIKCDFAGFRKSTNKWKSLSMDGANVMSFTLSEVPKAIYSYLKNSGKELKDYDHIVFHQANKFILERLYKKLGISEKGLIHIENCGNTVSSSIPLAMEGLTNQVNKNELNILLVGFGVGLSWGITSVRI
tara:strand:- start:5045 stop:5998 length:954 start_codon:yes stop_codon:yes gene_type:complete